MREKLSNQALVWNVLIVIFLNGCSDRYYEMYKSPCACISKKDLGKIYREMQNKNDKR